MHYGIDHRMTMRFNPPPPPNGLLEAVVDPEGNEVEGGVRIVKVGDRDVPTYLEN